MVALPAVSALGVAYGLSRALPHPTTVQGVLLWYAVMAAAMLVTVLVVERAARRLLPLAALLNVALLFPDQAPRRFAVARRVGRPKDIERRLRELRDTAPGSSELVHMQRVLELAAALSVHDRGTRGHSERVRIFTDLIAEEMGLSHSDRARLRWASLLHDIGKLLVPAEILRKPSALNDDEWQTIRQHPSEGARIIAPLRGWLGSWADAVEQHHERWDGKGYPRRLAGKDISLGGRIVAVADSYEVMTAPRPYRKALGVVAAREELVRCSGAQFDPAVVRAFLNVSVGRLWRVVGLGAWLAQVPFLSWFAGLGAPWGAAVASGATALALGVLPVVPVPGSQPVASPVAAVVPAPSASARPTGPAGPSVRSTSRPARATSSAPPAAGQPTPTPAALAASGPTPTPGPASSPSPSAGPTASAGPTPLATPSASPTPTPTPTPTASGPLTVTVPASSSISEQQTYTAAGSFSDPGGSGWTATADYGDGSGVQSLPLQGTGFTLDHAYGEACGCRVTVSVADAQGLTSQGQLTVTVGAGAAATVTINGGGVTLLGAYSSTGYFGDADLGSDHFTATVDYGDGSGAQPLALSGSNFVLSHQYPLLGTFTVTVRVTDDDGVTGVNQVTLTVV